MSIEIEDVRRSVEHKTFQLMSNFETKSSDDAIVISQVVALFLVSILSFTSFTFQYLFAISAICLLLSILILMIDKKKEFGLQLAWSLVFLLPMIFALAGLYSNPDALQFIGPNHSSSLELIAAQSSIEEYRATFRALFICVYFVPSVTLFLYTKLKTNHEKITDKLTEF